SRRLWARRCSYGRSPVTPSAAGFASPRRCGLLGAGGCPLGYATLAFASKAAPGSPPGGIRLAAASPPAGSIVSLFAQALVTQRPKGGVLEASCGTSTHRSSVGARFGTCPCRRQWLRRGLRPGPGFRECACRKNLPDIVLPNGVVSTGSCSDNRK